ncbi:hypothetical protein MMC07_009173 [Pseudocyphellaria aurata]|nr:hypothetical protein [Pseudocyphellaria aurata]
MSSATGRGEDEPLLGNPGDASQQDGQGIEANLILGTAVIAQAGIWLLTAAVWANVFLAPLSLFSLHPLFNLAGLFLNTQAILILQPTHTLGQKRKGTNIHAILNGIGVLAYIGGLVVIEYNKFAHNGAHFGTPHNVLGLIVYILFFVQAIIGVAQYYTPTVFGTVDNAKAIYKYHRASGYVILVLSLATVATATQTGFNENTLHIGLSVVIVASILTVVGVVPRIRKRKFGL